MVNKIKVFISYSQKDGEFAKQLNASFFSNSIQTFLDTKDILVGDSIPEKIYNGIGESTHLIYIMSASSVTSSWVKEEISIAKVKEKQAKGFKILPVLLDDIELPIGLAHILYADFRNWRDPYSYRNSFLLLLTALDIKPRLLASEDLIWYAKHSSKIQEHYILYSSLYGKIYGALDMIQDMGVFGAMPYKDKSRKEFEINLSVLKTAFENEKILKKLEYFYEQILFEIDESDSGRLSALKKKFNKIIDCVQKDFPYNNYNNYDKIARFQSLLKEITGMIQEIRNEVEIILLASIPTT
jgi:hypothetical protein